MIVLVAGGTGYLGSRVVKILEEEGHKVILHHRGHRAVPTYADVIINCVGIIRETRTQKFKDVHVDLVEWLVGLAKKLDVRQLVHVSALGADLEGTPYQRTKRLGELVIENSSVNYAIIRPSMMFGHDGGAIAQIARIARSGFFPLFANGKVQPVHVDVVAKVIVEAAKRRIRNRIVEVGGPEVMTYAQLSERIHPGVKTFRLPDALVRILCAIAIAPLPTRDMVRMMEQENTTRGRITKKLEIENLGMK